MRRMAVLLAGALLLSACGGEDKPSEPLPEAPAKIELGSIFEDGRPLPKAYTCDGAAVSPPLNWRGVPRGTRELTLIVEDSDADRFVHWTVLHIAPTTKESAEGAVPQNGVETKNSFGDGGWGAPCPPGGDDPHHYVFALYATDTRLGAEADASPDEVRRELAEHAIARGVLTGTFGRD